MESMPKRLTDSNIWKSQKWYRRLSPLHKLAWKYLTDLCDHAGVWKIDIGDLVDDLGIENFDLNQFMDACNSDYDKMTGQKIFRERIVYVGIEYIWLTGFISFQYGNSVQKIDIKNSIVTSALKILKSLGLYEICVSKEFIFFNEAPPSPPPIPPTYPGYTPGRPHKRKGKG